MTDPRGFTKTEKRIHNPVYPVKGMPVEIDPPSGYGWAEDPREQFVRMLAEAQDQSQPQKLGPWRAAKELIDKLEAWLPATAPEEEDDGNEG